MKRILGTAVLVLTFLTIQAKVYTIDNLPMVHLEDRNRYVCNPEGILSASAAAEIDQMFRLLEDSTGIQAIIAVVPEIEPADCFEFAHSLFQAKGVGQKDKDNGIVILLCTEERCIQFVTGYGLEGILPDALCKRVQVNYMNSHFSEGDWDTGMIEGCSQICSILLTGSEYTPFDDDADNAIVGLLLFIFMAVFGVSAVAYVADRRSRKCPECGKIALKAISRMTITKINGMKTELVTYECQNCHHKIQRKEKSAYQTGSSSGPHHYGGGSFSGGGFGGGGFGGGSFGGGRSGGGGAGSRF